MSTNPFDLLLFPEEPEQVPPSYRWATVTRRDPLQILLDWTEEPLEIVPINLAGPVAIGRRVWVQLFRGRDVAGASVFILGAAGGPEMPDDPPPPPAVVWKSVLGAGGYTSDNTYAVVGDVVYMYINQTAASGRSSGTVEDVVRNPPSELSHNGSSDLRFMLFFTSPATAVSARLFSSGKVNVYGAPAANAGNSIQGFVSYPTG